MRLENLVACALLKEVQRAIDVDGEDPGLHYVHYREGREVDFLLSRSGQPATLVEVK